MVIIFLFLLVSNYFRVFISHKTLETLKNTEKKVNVIFDARTKSKSTVVAFYHVFSPTRDKPFSNTQRIIQEQLDLMVETGLMQGLDALYYVTVGNVTIPSPHHSNPKLQHLYHVDGGFDEMLTLGMMYRYCRHHPRSIVLYFHDKGSFHPTAENERVRKALNCYVLNLSCLKALRSGHYDICGFRMSPIPHPHYSGNFFWADCAYVTRLIDPWTPALNNTFVNVTQHLHRYTYCLGVGRYFGETWITSAPQFRPADCLKTSSDPQYMLGSNMNESIFAFCPRRNESGNSSHYGAERCGQAAMFHNRQHYLAAYLGFNCGFARDELYRVMNERNRLWYGQPPSTYNVWIKSMEKLRVKKDEEEEDRRRKKQKQKQQFTMVAAVNRSH